MTADAPSEVAGVDSVVEVLGEAQRLGFVGRGPVAGHIDHALGFVAAWEAVCPGLRPSLVADMGSGGGLPGLVVAVTSGARVALIDAKSRRCDWLEEAVRRLGLSERVTVLNRPAEELARDPDWRGRFDVVVARSFAPPAPTSECAAGLVRRSGLVVVSEPPEGRRRWEGLVGSPLGFAEAVPVQAAVGNFVVLVADGDAIPGRIPRTWAAQRKRPVW